MVGQVTSQVSKTINVVGSKKKKVLKSRHHRSQLLRDLIELLIFSELEKLRIILLFKKKAGQPTLYIYTLLYTLV